MRVDALKEAPMFARFIPAELVKHHWRALTDRSTSKHTPDTPVRTVLPVVPMVAAIAAAVCGFQLQQPGSILSALALLTAGLLAAFAQLANIRSRYVAPDSSYDPQAPTRRLVDEAVAHVLVAALLAGITAVVLVVGMNATDGPRLPVWATTVVCLTGTYMALLFPIVLRQLWGAYVTANELSLDDDRATR